jgi:hypothetical protein
MKWTPGFLADRKNDKKSRLADLAHSFVTVSLFFFRIEI